MKTSVKYGMINGIIIGIFGISAFGILNWFNIHFHWGMQADKIRGVIGLLTILIQGTGIYAGMQQIKREQTIVTYSNGFKTGFTMAIITAVIASIFSLAYCTVFNPGYTDYMVNEAHKTMIASGESQQQIAKDLIGVRKEFSAGAQALMSLVGQFIIGTVLSLILATVAASKKK